ncbi:MAG: synaptic vesicle VAT-1 family membrane protein [Myxococcota bacterium]
MRKVVVPRAGGYERLIIEDLPTPSPGEGEVLVEVEAIGVNYADCVVRMGLYESAKQYVGWPITPGFEGAGRVAAVGHGVNDLTVGDPVIVVTRFGGYATHIVAPRGQVFRRPEVLSAAQAAGIPCVYLTAYFALFFLAHPRSGDTLLIHSAAGGVGTAAVQLARDAGLRTVGVVGASHKVAACQADEVIDKSTSDLWTEAERLSPAGYPVILDANGPSTLAQSYAHLAPPGKLVVYGFHSMMPRKGGKPKWLKLAIDYFKTPRFNPLDMTGSNRSVLAFNLSYLFDRSDILQEVMVAVCERFDEGRLTPMACTTYDFERVADAHRDLESAQTIGKLVLLT